MIDPADYSVQEVKDWVLANWHDHRNDTTFVSVHNAERDGKARVSLLDWLDHFAEDNRIDLLPADKPEPPDPPRPDPLSDDEMLIRQLKSWGLTGEPITWAEKRMQPVIFAIRAANTGFGTLATVQGLLDISYPLNDINASDVCLPIALREPTVQATKDSDGRFHLVTEDQGVDVTWFVDHGVVGHGPVHDIVLAPGRQYVIAAQVSVAGVVWTKEVTVEGAEVVSV